MVVTDKLLSCLDGFQHLLAYVDLEGENVPFVWNEEGELEKHITSTSFDPDEDDASHGPLGELFDLQCLLPLAPAEAPIKSSSTMSDVTTIVECKSKRHETVSVVERETVQKIISFADTTTRRSHHHRSAKSKPNPYSENFAVKPSKPKAEPLPVAEEKRGTKRKGEASDSNLAKKSKKDVYSEMGLSKEIVRELSLGLRSRSSRTPLMSVN